MIIWFKVVDGPDGYTFATKQQFMVSQIMIEVMTWKLTCAQESWAFQKE